MYKTSRKCMTNNAGDWSLNYNHVSIYTHSWQTTSHLRVYYLYTLQKALQVYNQTMIVYLPLGLLSTLRFKSVSPFMWFSFRLPCYSMWKKISWYCVFWMRTIICAAERVTCGSESMTLLWVNVSTSFKFYLWIQWYSWSWQ